MMTDSDYKIAENLPASINLEPIPDIARVVDDELAGINPDLLLIYPAIDSLPESLIDYLANQMHVDDYDKNADLLIKRSQVKLSFILHRFRGTKYGVELAVNTIYTGACVKEWFEYSGHPYHFVVSAGENEITAGPNIRQVVKTINTAKNARSWLDYIEFDRNITQRIHVGFVKKLETDVCVYPINLGRVSTASPIYAGVVMTMSEKIVLREV
ncbi:phage tail protein, P2 protein I family [Megasphaera elsdenii]|uniref:phage tail protein n=1 Tax=Megasphaera elsdenii TaxID=907 RepID=UPI0008F050C5|nr:phage tail protein [Megasphaera elsdenii]SFH78618.1 phage tail protein, P2 protein I family [Megasphaera elsdenii]